MTTDTAMVERVARALAGQDIEIDSSIGQTYAELANTAIVAVLECLRTPTPDMAYIVAKAIAEEFDHALDDLPNSEFMDFISAAKTGIAAYVDAALSSISGDHNAS